MKEVLYYVLKYEDKYYAPYQSSKTYSAGMGVQNILSSNKRLAIRFGDKEFAEEMRSQEVMSRSFYREVSFDEEKCRVVAVVRKTPSVH